MTGVEPQDLDKALIPAAGRGSRWHPWSSVIPKELLPVGPDAALAHVLEEAVAAGIGRVGIVTSPAKPLIATYVKTVWQRRHPLIDIRWFEQTHARGVGDALLCAQRWVAGQPVAVLYPDMLHPAGGGIVPLCRAFRRSPGHWIGLSGHKPDRRHGTLVLRKNTQGDWVVQVPSDRSEPGQSAYGTGRYILENGLDHVNPWPDGTLPRGHEFDDDRILAPLWRQNFRALLLPEIIHDVGTPENWRRTVEYFGHPMPGYRRPGVDVPVAVMG